MELSPQRRISRSVGCPLEKPVLMSVVAISAAGILMGLRYKAPALVAATALLLVGSIVWNALGLPGVSVAGFLVLAFTLGCAYLVGLALAVRFGWHRN